MTVPQSNTQREGTSEEFSHRWINWSHKALGVWRRPLLPDSGAQEATGAWGESSVAAPAPHGAQGEACRSQGTGGGGTSVLTVILGCLRAPAGKNKLEGLVEKSVWECVKHPEYQRNNFRETQTMWKHLENGLMMFYNRNELYSYSKFNIYKKLQQTNASTQNLPFSFWFTVTYTTSPKPTAPCRQPQEGESYKGHF